MNKTLLLIICDFLLISILALVEFKTEDPDPQIEDATVLRDSTADLLELLQLSLENESQQRSEVETALADKSSELDETRESLQQTADNLDATRRDLENVSSTLELTAAEKAALADAADELSRNLLATRSTLQLTEAEKARMAEALAETRRRSEALQADLQSEQQRAQRTAEELAAAEANLRDLERNTNTLQTELRIRDTERQMLEQNLVTARAEVERARLEAQAAERRVESLSAGVSELAASSSAMQEEIRQAQPQSLNAIFRQFEDNRLLLRFDWTERRLLGPLTRSAEVHALLMEYNGEYYALFSTDSTPLDSNDKFRAMLRIGERQFAISEVGRLRSDRSLATVRVPAATVAASGLQATQLSADPLRFPEAVLISNTSPVYGEIPARIPPGEPGRLQIESRLFSRLFGEYSPRTGDFVFSKSGSLIGIMVAPNRALMLDSLAAQSYQQL